MNFFKDFDYIKERNRQNSSKRYHKKKKSHLINSPPCNSNQQKDNLEYAQNNSFSPSNEANQNVSHNFEIEKENIETTPKFHLNISNVTASDVSTTTTTNYDNNESTTSIDESPTKTTSFNNYHNDSENSEDEN